jgi:hypothetical protein
VLQEEVSEEARKVAGYKGAELQRLHLDTFELNLDAPGLRDAINAQRIHAWQAEWVSQATEQVGLSRARALRLREIARAQAQTQMLIAITEGLRGVPGSSPPQQLVALRFIQSIEQIAPREHDRLSAHRRVVQPGLAHVGGLAPHAR